MLKYGFISPDGREFPCIKGKKNHWDVAMEIAINIPKEYENRKEDYPVYRLGFLKIGTVSTYKYVVVHLKSVKYHSERIYKYAKNGYSIEYTSGE